MTMSATYPLSPAWREDARSEVEPFAEGGFDIVPETEAAIAEIREKLNGAFGTRKGGLPAVESVDLKP